MESTKEDNKRYGKRYKYAVMRVGGNKWFSCSFGFNGSAGHRVKFML